MIIISSPQSGTITAGVESYASISCSYENSKKSTEVLSFHEIVFNLKDWLSFEGNTGPYLLYAYARCKSILRKNNFQSGENIDFSLLTQPEEKELLTYMNGVNEAIYQSCLQNKPSILCQHLFKLCQSYNRMFVKVSVQKSENEQKKQARLFLLFSFSTLLGDTLQLIGIDTLEQM